jgi:enoyl-CoA hydratase/carnithine racemase
MIINNDVDIKEVEDGIASLRIATDENPYLGTIVPALTDAVEKIKTLETIRAVIVEGGSRYFSAGASRDTLLPTDLNSIDPRLLSPCKYFARVSQLILSLPVPTIAAMTGHAIGGGLILGLWCDMAVLAEESMYGANFAALGMTPGMGAIAVLEEALGPPLARELLYTGRLVKGRELKTSNCLLVHAIVPRKDVQNRALAIAREVADIPREVLLLLKQTLSEKRKKLLEGAASLEAQMQDNLFSLEQTRLQIAQRYPASS